MIIIPDIESGNVQSLKNAMEYINNTTRLSNNPSTLSEKDILILPGVGNFGNFMSEIKKKGWFEPIMSHYTKGGKIIGICVGFQAFFKTSSESPDIPGFGFLQGEVKRIDNKRLPIIGYADVSLNGNNIGDFYFIHSYGVKANEFNDCVSKKYIYSNSDDKYLAGIYNKNILGVQFHPEKSGLKGIKFIENFIKDKFNV